MISRAATLVGILLAWTTAPGCRTVPEPGVLERAARLSDRGALDQALALLDAVPPGNPSHRHARTQARALERRIHKSYEKVVQGLVLRSELRDPEALVCFQAARDIWTGIAVDPLIEATRHRLAQASEQRSLQSETATNVEEGIGMVVTESFVLPDDPNPIPAMRDHEVVDHLPPAVRFIPAAELDLVDPDPASAPAFESGPSAAEPVHSKRRRVLLAESRRLLDEGELSRAIRLLEDLLQRDSSGGVRATLAAVLSQRALLAYGRGQLLPAVRDWRRVVELDPAHSAAQAYLLAATTELNSRAPVSDPPSTDR